MGAPPPLWARIARPDENQTVNAAARARRRATDRCHASSSSSKGPTARPARAHGITASRSCLRALDHDMAGLLRRPVARRRWVSRRTPRPSCQKKTRPLAHRRWALPGRRSRLVFALIRGHSGRKPGRTALAWPSKGQKPRKIGLSIAKGACKPQRAGGGDTPKGLQTPARWGERHPKGSPDPNALGGDDT